MSIEPAAQLQARTTGSPSQQRKQDKPSGVTIGRTVLRAPTQRE